MGKVIKFSDLKEYTKKPNLSWAAFGLRQYLKENNGTVPLNYLEKISTDERELKQAIYELKQKDFLND